ncbi:MAG: c-type cytochrome [Melioribacteraceae bacterium]
MKKLLVIVLTLLFSMLIINCGGDSKPVAKKAKSMIDKAKTEKAELVVDLANGKKTYEKICTACHATGVGGAAALTNKVRWQANADKGILALQKSVIKGVAKGEGKYGIMAPRGSCADCSDKDIYDAIGYMISEADVKLK